MIYKTSYSNLSILKVHLGFCLLYSASYGNVWAQSDMPEVMQKPSIMSRVLNNSQIQIRNLRQRPSVGLFKRLGPIWANVEQNGWAVGYRQPVGIQQKIWFGGYANAPYGNWDQTCVGFESGMAFASVNAHGSFKYRYLEGGFNLYGLEWQWLGFRILPGGGIQYQPTHKPFMTIKVKLPNSWNQWTIESKCAFQDCRGDMQWTFGLKRATAQSSTSTPVWLDRQLNELPYLHIPPFNDQQQLNVAIDQANQSAMQYLLDTGPELNRGEGSLKEDLLYEKLLAAIQDNKQQSVECLISYCNTEAALLKAIELDKSEIVTLLLKDRTLAEQSSGEIALSKAINSGKLNIAKLLFGYGAQVNEQEFRTLLSKVILSKDVDLTQWLLEGKTLDMESIEDRNLFVGACGSDIDVVQFLLKKGANPNIKNAEGVTPLLGAVRSTNLSITKLLLDEKAFLNVGDNEKTTPLYHAVSDANFELVNLLISHGVDVNKKSIHNKTPLFMAIEKGSIEIIKLLLECGADVDVMDSYRKTPIFYAVQKGNLEAVHLLLKYKATLASGKYNLTILHEAAKYNPNIVKKEDQIDIIGLLVKQDPSFLKRQVKIGEEKLTPLQVAERAEEPAEHQEVINLLTELEESQRGRSVSRQLKGD